MKSCGAEHGRVSRSDNTRAVGADSASRVLFSASRSDSCSETPSSISAPVYAVVVGQQERARLLALLGSARRGGTHFQLLDSAAALRGACAARSPSVVIIEARDANGETCDAVVRGIRSGFPSATILGWVRLSSVTSRDVLLLARSGIHDLVIQGLDDDAAMIHAVLTNTTHCRMFERVEPMLRPWLCTTGHRVFRFALESAVRPISVLTLAAGLGVHRRTLAKRLYSRGLPSPREVVAWCRLMLAAGLLEDPARTVEQVAHELEFPSANAFRNLLQRYTGMTPSDLRRGGGLQTICDLLLVHIKRSHRKCAESAELL